MPKDNPRAKANKSLRKEAENRLSLRRKAATPGETDSDRLTHELQVHQIELEMQNEELTRTRLEIEESRERYIDLYDFAPVGYLTLDETGMISQLNLTAAGLLGIERKYLVHTPFHRLLQPGFEDAFYFHTQAVLSSSVKQTCEIALKRADGTSFYAQLDTSKTDIEGERVMRVVLTDITGRKLARETMERLASFPQLSPNPILEINVSGEIIFFNPASQAMLESLGLDRGDLRAFLPEDLNSILRDLDKKTGSTFRREVHMADRVLAETLHLVPQFSVVRLYASDITERARAEEALEQANRRLRTTLESITDGFVSFDSEWRYTYVNEAASRLLQHSREELMGRTPWAVFPESPHLEFYTRFILSCDEGRPVHFEEYYPEPLNRWFECHCYPEPEGLSVYFRDVTERKLIEEALQRYHEELEEKVKERTAELTRAYETLRTETEERRRVEEQLAQLRKMEALGTLTGGIAHDFNNILAAIIGFAEMSLDDTPPRNLHGAESRTYPELLFASQGPHQATAHL